MELVGPLVLVILALSAVTGQELSSKGPRFRGPLTENEGAFGIFNGKNTTLEKHPYMVSLLMLGWWYCAGSIVSQRWALITAGCVMDSRPDMWTLAVGSPDGRTEGTIYNLSKIIIHPKFNSYDNEYDFACIQVQGRFHWSKLVRPIKLPKKQPNMNSLLNVAGWGRSACLGCSSPAILRETRMHWVSNTVCSSFYSQYFNVTDSMACGYNKGKTTLCLGDWGDAFVKKGVIYGMFSVGDENSYWCTADAWPLILSNVQRVAPWIKRVTGAKYEDEP